MAYEVQLKRHDAFVVQYLWHCYTVALYRSHKPPSALTALLSHHYVN